MHAAVGAPGDGQLDRPAQQDLERRAELTRDGALPGLDGPAVEARSVVLERQPSGQTNSR
jgi:hypothetical protein